MTMSFIIDVMAKVKSVFISHEYPLFKPSVLIILFGEEERLEVTVLMTVMEFANKICHQ